LQALEAALQPGRGYEDPGSVYGKNEKERGREGGQPPAGGVNGCASRVR